MNLLLPTFALFLSIPWLLPTAQEPAPSTKPPAPLAALAWLAGEWRGKLDGADVVEWHSDPAGGAIVMASKELKSGKAPFFDFGLIAEKDGKVTFVPYPKGKASVPFVLTGFEAKVQSATFVNEQHDFPKKFVFARKGDALTITLTGDEGGKPTTVVYELKLAGAR